MATKRAPVRVLRTSQRLIILALIIILILLLRGFPKPIERLFKPAKPTYLRSIYAKKGKLGLDQPLGIAFNKKNNWLYVTSAKNARVFVLDEDYKHLFSFGEKQLKVPVFIAVNGGGSKVYVTDRAQKAVMVFSAQGNFLQKLKLKELSNPLAITVDNDDNIYITNTGREHRVIKYDSGGNLVLKFGYKKRAVPVTSAESGFFYPNGIAVDSKQNIYIADSNNGRIQIFDKEGNFKKLIITGGLPRGIALNERARLLFIADALRHRVEMYDLKTGSQRANFSQLGSGESDVAFPNSVLLKGKKLEEVLIVDRENDRVQLYKTELSITDVLALIRPYASYWSLPVLGFLLLFLVSRRRRYIIGDCFVKAVLKQRKLAEALVLAGRFHVSPSLLENLEKSKLLPKFEDKIIHNERFNHNFASKLVKKRDLNILQAEALALARHRGIYQPVLLACDAKLIEAADDFGVKTMDLASFFKTKVPSR